MTRTEVREWLQTLGLVAIPIIVGITGNGVAKANATREVDVRMVEIAAQVLAGPANDSTKALRGWAVKVLAGHSDVPFSAAVESTLVRRGLTTQFGGGPGLTTQRPNSRSGPFTVCDPNGQHCTVYDPLPRKP